MAHYPQNSSKGDPFDPCGGRFPLTFDGNGSPIERQGDDVTKNELILGTLDMLILRVVSQGDMHGWGIAEQIGQLSHEALSVGEGSLYPALYRMEQRGWIQSEWGLI